MSTEHEEQQVKLIQIVKDAIQLDITLRDKYQVGEKFRFVRERLKTLLTTLEKTLAELKAAAEAEKKVEAESAQDVIVYVYLYNAQGVVLRSWINMLTPKVFYEYSINRPIYSERNTIDSLVRAKANKMQHAYLTVAIKPEHILPPGDKPLKDSIGNPLLRVKEGSLRFEKFVSLTHNGEDYVLNARGELAKKIAE